MRATEYTLRIAAAAFLIACAVASPFITAFCIFAFVFQGGPSFALPIALWSGFLTWACHAAAEAELARAEQPARETAA